VTSIERTAYPQFKRLTSARVLHVFFTPAADEVVWARERTASPEALLALVVDLKCFQKMARFCSREEIPRPSPITCGTAWDWARRSSLITGRRGLPSGTAGRYGNARA
jgi:hypothetical protein